jgi:hypothetical protein
MYFYCFIVRNIASEGVNMCTRRHTFPLLLSGVLLLPVCQPAPTSPLDTSGETNSAGTSILSKMTMYSRTFFIDDEFLYYYFGNTTVFIPTPEPQPLFGPRYYVTSISRVDRRTGANRTLQVETPKSVSNLFVDGAYCYLYGNDFDSSDWARADSVFRNRNDSLARDWTSSVLGIPKGVVYRFPKSGEGKPEIVASFSRQIRELKVNGDEMCLTYSDAPGLYHMHFSDSVPTLLTDNCSWFEIDDRCIFWETWSAASGHNTLWRMSRGDGSLVMRANGIPGSVFLKGEYIYYRTTGEDAKVMRLGKSDNSGPATVMQLPAQLDEVCGGVWTGDAFCFTNYNGELWCVAADNPDSAILLDKWGSFDDDEFAAWLGCDGTALYWVAGPDKDVWMHSGEDTGVVLKTPLPR